MFATSENQTLQQLLTLKKSLFWCRLVPCRRLAAGAIGLLVLCLSLQLLPSEVAAKGTTLTIPMT